MAQHAASSREPFELDIQTSFGRLRGRMRLPSGGMRLAELAWNLLRMDDQLVSLGVARATGPQAGGRQVSCCKGCGACCRQLVPLSPPEVFMLADLVSSFPDERREVVMARFAQTREALQRAGIESVAGPAKASDSVIADVALKYFELGLPCPFLEDESCSIHADRPSICREYLVTSPAALCADLRHNRVARVPVPLQFSDCLSQLSAHVVGGEAVTVPMPAALGWADQHWDEGQRRYDAKYLFTTLAGIIKASPPPAL